RQSGIQDAHLRARSGRYPGPPRRADAPLLSRLAAGLAHAAFFAAPTRSQRHRPGAHTPGAGHRLDADRPIGLDVNRVRTLPARGEEIDNRLRPRAIARADEIGYEEASPAAVLGEGGRMANDG